MPCHVGEPLAHDPPEQLLVGDVDDVGRGRQVRGHPRGAEQLPALGELGGEGDAAVARNGGTHLGERLTREFFDGADLLCSPPRIALAQAVSEPGFQRDRGERVPEQVVQVAGDARALVVGGQPGDLGAGLGQGDVGLAQPIDGVGDDADNGNGERGDIVEGLGQAVVPRRDRHGHDE